MSDNIHQLFGGPDLPAGSPEDAWVPELTPAQERQAMVVQRVLRNPGHTQRVVSAAVVLRDELDPESTAFKILDTIIDEVK